MTPLLLASSACGVAVLAIYLIMTAEKVDKKKKNDGVDEADEYRIQVGYNIGDHDQELEEERKARTRKSRLGRQSMYDRIVKKMLGHSLNLGRRFTPVSYVERTTAKMRHAGKRGTDELDRFLAIRVITAGLGVLFIVLAFLAMHGSIVIPNIQTKVTISIFGFMALLALGGPEAQLNRQAEARQTLIQQTLPDILDLLTISVEAGLGFEQAIQYVAEMMDGPLSDEFNRMNAEMRAGASRAIALKSLDDRCGVEDVGHFVLAILQADRFGVSIARILRSQADEMRTKRHQIAQETAQKAPVKMLIPMTVFIFPPLFIVVLGPALMSIAANFKA